MITQHIVALSPLTCDLCGLPIQAGDTYRLITDRRIGRTYREHIRCPGAAATVIKDPRPTPPKIRTDFNHAFCMA